MRTLKYVNKYYVFILKQGSEPEISHTIVSKMQHQVSSPTVSMEANHRKQSFSKHYFCFLKREKCLV